MELKTLIKQAYNKGKEEGLYTSHQDFAKKTGIPKPTIEKYLAQSFKPNSIEERMFNVLYPEIEGIIINRFEGHETEIELD